MIPSGHTDTQTHNCKISITIIGCLPQAALVGTGYNTCGIVVGNGRHMIYCGWKNTCTYSRELPSLCIYIQLELCIRKKCSLCSSKSSWLPYRWKIGGRNVVERKKTILQISAVTSLSWGQDTPSYILYGWVQAAFKGHFVSIFPGKLSIVVFLWWIQCNALIIHIIPCVCIGSGGVSDSCIVGMSFETVWMFSSGYSFTCDHLVT